MMSHPKNYLTYSSCICSCRQPEPTFIFHGFSSSLFVFVTHALSVNRRWICKIKKCIWDMNRVYQLVQLRAIHCDDIFTQNLKDYLSFKFTALLTNTLKITILSSHKKWRKYMPYLSTEKCFSWNYLGSLQSCERKGEISDKCS